MVIEYFYHVQNFSNLFIFESAQKRYCLLDLPQPSQLITFEESPLFHERDTRSLTSSISYPVCIEKMAKRKNRNTTRSMSIPLLKNPRKRTPYKEALWRGGGRVCRLEPQTAIGAEGTLP